MPYQKRRSMAQRREDVSLAITPAPAVCEIGRAAVSVVWRDWRNSAGGQDRDKTGKQLFRCPPSRLSFSAKVLRDPDYDEMVFSFPNVDFGMVPFVWLTDHPRFHFHFTPTGASWLNLVERFFAEITRKRLRRGTFRSVPALIAAIRAYVRAHNTDPRPFIWTASAAAILRKIKRCKEALETGH